MFTLVLTKERDREFRRKRRGKSQILRIPEP